MCKQTRAPRAGPCKPAGSGTLFRCNRFTPMKYLVAGIAITALISLVILLRRQLAGRAIAQTRRDQANATHYTIRMFEPGSDPVTDRIELHLRRRDEAE